MSFVDNVQIRCSAGRGGNGLVSFRREKFIDKGGPNGGDGGDGGSVVLKASRNHNTLASFRYQKEIRADDGQAGGKNRRHGKTAPNLIVKIPVGTVVIDVATDEIIVDLVDDGQEFIVAKGGIGGFGNAHFVSSVRQTPKFSEKGEEGEIIDLKLELKMIADVGIVGLPNAGKSTLLSKLSNAKPEIADYPFTTLIPNLGVVDIGKSSSVLLADIPGLIEGAAEGKGLGHDFLRHIERTAVILHLVDSYNENVAKAYQTIRSELEAYRPELTKRPEIIALTKTEGLDSEIIDDLSNQLQKVKSPQSSIQAISVLSGEGVKQLLFSIKKAVEEVRNEPEPEEKKDKIPIIKLKNVEKQWNIVKKGKKFYVTGQKIEQFAKRTDFDNEEGVQRLRDIMRRQGIMHELSRQKIEAGQTVQIGMSEEQSFIY